MRTKLSPEERKLKDKERCKRYYEAHKQKVLEKNARNRKLLKLNNPEKYAKLKKGQRDRHNARDHVKFRQATLLDEKREWIWNYKSTHPCVNCGEDDPIVLQFHHLKDKTAAIASIAAHPSWSLERIKAEVAKCAMLCSHCHLRLHHAERQARLAVSPAVILDKE